MAHAVHGHGAPAMRVEDEPLVTGRGRYASDWNLPGQLYAHFVRANRAHAEIVAINVDAAAKYPGVKRIYTGEDAVRAGYTKLWPLPARFHQHGAGGCVPRRRPASHRQLHGLLHAARRDDSAHPDGGQSDSSHQQEQ